MSGSVDAIIRAIFHITDVMIQVLTLTVTPPPPSQLHETIVTVCLLITSTAAMKYGQNVLTKDCRRSSYFLVAR